MRYDRRHFTKLEDMYSEIRWAQLEQAVNTDPIVVKTQRQEERKWRKKLSDYRRARPGVLKAYNLFLKKGGDTLN